AVSKATVKTIGAAIVTSAPSFFRQGPLARRISPMHQSTPRAAVTRVARTSANRTPSSHGRRFPIVSAIVANTSKHAMTWEKYQLHGQTPTPRKAVANAKPNAKYAESSALYPVTRA